MNTLIRACCIFLLSATAIVAEAKLNFDSPSFKATAEFGQEKVPFEFIFENKGDRAVEITDIKTSCGCTTSALDKRIYQPGEVGLIEGEYKVGDRHGIQSQHVHLKTDDPAQPELHLEVVVSIAEALNIAPKLVFWRSNEVPEPKIVKLSPAKSSGLQVTGVTVDSDAFVVELLERDSPRDPLELIVAPVVTDAASRGLVTISTTFKDGRTKDFVVHAMIR